MGAHSGPLKTCCSFGLVYFLLICFIVCENQEQICGLTEVVRTQAEYACFFLLCVKTAALGAPQGGPCWGSSVRAAWGLGRGGECAGALGWGSAGPQLCSTACPLPGGPCSSTVRLGPRLRGCWTERPSHGEVANDRDKRTRLR